MSFIKGPPSIVHLNADEKLAATLMLEKFKVIAQNSANFAELVPKIKASPKPHIDTALPHNETLRFNKEELLENIADELSHVKQMAETHGFIHILSLAYTGRMLRAAMEISKELDDDLAKQVTTEAFEATLAFTKLTEPRKTYNTNKVFILEETDTTNKWLERRKE